MTKGAQLQTPETISGEENKELWTYQEYLELPEDGKIYQLLEGRLEMSPAPGTRHQRVSRNLEMIIWEHVKKNNLGEVFDAPIDVIFNQFNVIQPDIVFVSKEKQPLIKEAGIFGAPDLVIEINSPGTLHVDAKHKKGIYERFGVREYWIVDPLEKKIDVYILKGGHYVFEGIFTENDSLRCKCIEGLSILLTEIFE